MTFSRLFLWLGSRHMSKGQMFRILFRDGTSVEVRKK